MILGQNVRYVRMDIMCPSVSSRAFQASLSEFKLKFIGLGMGLNSSFSYFVKNYQISRSSSLIDNFQVF